MAVTTIQSNNKLIQFTRDINREFVRNNLFSPYMGEGLDAVIRRRMEQKLGGEQMNIPLVTKLAGVGMSTGTLAGNEERIDNYGMRLYVDWWRHAVVTTKSESFKDSADVFGIAKPLLSDRGKELLRDELISAFMALPSESAPAALGTENGQRVNGILWELSTSAQRNAWLADNVDRVLFGNAISNHISGTTIASCGSALSVIASVKLGATTIQMLKRRAELCSPKIRPYRTEEGYEYYVLFVGTHAFRDAKLDSNILNTSLYARPREGRTGIGGAPDQPIFQDGDLMYDGVIVRKVPEISTFVDNTWTGMSTAAGTFSSGGGTAASSSGRTEPVFLCGQQAAVVGYGQMLKPTFRKEDDYGFITGTGIEGAYGVAKMFKKGSMFISPNVLNSSGSGNTSGGGTGSLTQWGTVTGFFYAAKDT